jgi:uncharacterized protein YjdB
MQTLLKQSIIGGLSFLLLTGIAFSVGSSEPSVFEGEAATFTNTISKYDANTCSTSFANDAFLSFGTTNCSIKSVNNGSPSITVKYKRNSTSTHTLLGNTSTQIRLYGGTSNNGGELEFEISSGYEISSVAVDLGGTNIGFSVNGGSSITVVNSISTTNLAANTTKVNIKNVASSGRVDFDSFEFTYKDYPVTGISITPETSSISGIGNTQQLTATLSPANATNKNVNWSSSDESVVTVNSSGLVSAVGVGSATITATTVDGSFTDTALITVESIVSVNSISVSLASSTIASNSTTQATETVLPAEATIKEVTWSSSNTSIATVNSSGLVTANNTGLAGTSVIRATATDGSGVFGEATLTVSPVNVTSVSVTPETATIVGLGNTQQLTATISPNNATNKNITWASSDDAIATVNASGLVTSIAAGVVTITVTTEDGSFTDTSTITVSYVAVSSITLSSNEVTLYTAGTFRTLTLTATISPENASNKTITWSSSNSGVASVSSVGLVTGLSVGSAIITATSNDNNSITATANITVLARTVTNVTIKTNTTKTTFSLGENIYSPSMVLTISYNDTTSEDVTSGYTLTGYNSKQLGTQTISITYPGFSGTSPTYNIFVTNVGSATPTVASDLFISEYIEGSSNNKAIEIFNGTGAGVSLSNYKLRVHANGGTSTTNIDLGATTLANNSTFVIANGSSSASILALSNANSGSINFNGDDAVSLFKVSTSTNIDVIGTIGVDPGTEFTGQSANGDGSTLDKTITRTSNIYQPSSTFKFEEWNTYPMDTISNLGSHTFSPLTALEQSQSFADYLEQFTTCDLTGPDSISTLVSEYNAMTAPSKTAFSSLSVDDYDNEAYLANGSSYSSLTRTATVNALTKLNKIISLYNSQNPSNTVVLNARIPNINTTEDNHLAVIFIISISTLFGMLWFFKRRNYSN